MKVLLFILFISQSILPSFAQNFNNEIALSEYLQSFKGIKVASLENKDHYKFRLKLLFEQPVDHNNPDGEKFQQLIYLNHVDVSKPMVLVTHGYDIRNRASEPSRMLLSNQINVEYRYNGQSKPIGDKYTFLSSKQAAEDFHRITVFFKNIYKEKWLSTGISKSGVESLLYRYKYPKDVDATIAYVSPINKGIKDPRLNAFFNTQVDQSIQKRIEYFQRQLLINKEKIFPLFLAHKADKYSYQKLTASLAYDYNVLDLMFSFWQLGGKAEMLPEEQASNEVLFESFKKIQSFYWFSDDGIKAYEPFIYQANREIGYYIFNTQHLKDLLEDSEHYCFFRLSPLIEKVPFEHHKAHAFYSSKIQGDALKWLESSGEKIIYIYGKNDPWSATAVKPNQTLDALFFMVEGMDHKVKMKDLNPKDLELIKHKLNEWTGLTLIND